MAERRGTGDGRVMLLALAVFLGVAAWIISHLSASREPYQPPYSSYSSNAAGVRALYELLAARGNDVSRHLLSEHEYPQGSCVVIADESALNPFKMLMNPLNVKALELHVRDGGSVVIFCDDNMAFVSELDELLSSLHASEEDWTPGEAAALAKRGAAGGASGSGTWRGGMQGQQFELAQSRPPLLAGVDKVEIAHSWNQPQFGYEPLLEVEDSSSASGFSPIVSFSALEGGRIVFVNAPELVTNDWIERADNHRLALALIEGTAQGAPVLFDEHIHGYDAQRMTAGSLLTHSTGGRLTLVAVCCILLMYLGLAILPARIHPSRTPPRRQASEMVLGQASLFQRAGFVSGSLRHIVDGLKHELLHGHYYGHLPSDAELLDWARLNMPAGWKIDPQLENYLRGGGFPASNHALMKASLSCDAMRMHAWQRPG
ncbi:MAG: DUF4350 domain-containing protein [bacterium]